MKRLTLLSCFIVTACAGGAFDPEHRKQATLNLFEGGGCDEFILAVDNPNSEQGWKSQREFVCKARLGYTKSLDGKIYTKEEMKKLEENDPFIHNLFYP